MYVFASASVVLALPAGRSGGAAAIPLIAIALMVVAVIAIVASIPALKGKVESALGFGDNDVADDDQSADGSQDDLSVKDPIADPENGAIAYDGFDWDIYEEAGDGDQQVTDELVTEAAQVPLDTAPPGDV